MVPSGDDEEKTSIIKSDTFTGKIKSADESPPAFVVLIGPRGYVGRQFVLSQAEFVIGRSIDSTIFVDDPSLSRNHAKVIVQGSEVAILDLGSSNKTLVNEIMLPSMTPMKLKNNDQIKTGNIIFKFLAKGNIEAVTNRELNEKALKDALTSAYSKGALLEKGPESIKRAEFLNEELSVIVFDIDHFKKINDKFGHSAGDVVLKELSHVILTKMIRQHDYFARYGGEEFVVILPGVGTEKAMEIGERLRATIEGTTFNSDGNVIPVTISLGVANRKSNEGDWSKLFKRADEALYQSKQTGRNRVTLAS